MTDQSNDSFVGRYGFRTGENVFIRSTNYHYTGTVKRIDGMFLVLENASWITDLGRFSDFQATGVPASAERYPNGIDARISLGHIVDWNPFPFTLPLE